MYACELNLLDAGQDKVISRVGVDRSTERKKGLEGSECDWTFDPSDRERLYEKLSSGAHDDHFRVKAPTVSS
jgi:hypothetical protein